MFTKCGNFTETENLNKTTSICRYENFLCTNDEQPCLYVNSTMYNFYLEKMETDYTEYSPSIIIKTCPRSKVHSYVERKKRKNSVDECHTTKCKSGDDCLSGNCLYERCIYDIGNEKLVYMCSGELYPDELLRCGLTGGMKTFNETLCFSKAEIGGYCLAYGRENSTSLVLILTICIMVGVIVLIFLIAGCFFFLWPKIKDRIDDMRDNS